MRYRTSRRAGTPLIIAPLAALAPLGGCASSSGPQAITVSAESYESAFDAAVESARSHGWATALKDRRGGVIETDTTPAASIFEPWKGDNASRGQAHEHTVGFERRRARFEFMPAGLDPASAVDGVDDLTDFAQALELRVLVTVERASRPGLRSSTWSQLRSSSAIIIPPANSGQPLPGQHWVPLGRDEAFERRLLAEVEQAVVAAAAK